MNEWNLTDKNDWLNKYNKKRLVEFYLFNDHPSILKNLKWSMYVCMYVWLIDWLIVSIKIDRI